MAKVKEPECVLPEAQKVDAREIAPSIKPQGVIQDFNQLRQECLSMKKLFEDPEFPAQDSSLYLKKKTDKTIEWKRPTEIADDPKLFVDGFSRFDLNQGDLQNCWFVAAAANLAMHPNLLVQVVPEDQSFQVNYAGIFHFRFWQYGRWVDVVIDDRLPTDQGKLIYLSSTENVEFWSALLEKAYAKLHGSYESLAEGTTCEAMEDFTGGVTEIYQMNAIPPDLFSILLNAEEKNSFMGCIVEQGSNIKESETPQGLIRWHSYSITQVKCVDRRTPDQLEKVLLLRLRNPWGNRHEWNGKWSDESSEWKRISDSEREELGLIVDFDGEFWISFQDFKRYFSSLDICSLSPDSLTDLNIGKKKWHLSAVEGEWVCGVSAGGCDNFPETFWQNPQYRVTLEDPDGGDDKCTVIVALLQKNRRAQKWKGVARLHIGFTIYHLKDSNDGSTKLLDKDFFDKYSDDYVAHTRKYLNDREVSHRFKFPAGVYCIVPSTFEPHEEGEFLLRVFSESETISIEENARQVDSGDADDWTGDCTLL